MAFQTTENAIPIRNLSIYSDIYGLGIADSEINDLNRYWSDYQGKGADFLFIHSTGTTSKDFVLNFKTTKEPVLNLELKDEVAVRNNYKVFKLPNTRYYLKFAPKPEDIKYVNLMGSIKNVDKKSFVFQSMEELRDHLFFNDMQLFLDRGPLKLIDVEFIYWLSGKMADFSASRYLARPAFTAMPDYTKYIIDVLQLLDDTRVAIYIEKSTSEYGGVVAGMKVRTYVVKPDNQAYNWTDPDRYFSHIDKKSGYGKVYYVGPDPKFPPERAIAKYARGQKHVVIENSMLESVARRDQRKQVEEAAITQAMGDLRTKMEQRIKDLQFGKSFTFNDVTFREDAIEYEGQILTSPDVKTEEVITGLLDNLDDEKFNFEQIFKMFCNVVIGVIGKKSPTTDNTSATVGAITVNLLRKDRQNVDGILTTMFYVNEKRINKEDILPVMQRALCYTKDADFMQFLESVSTCSLRFHRAIASGIVLKVMDNLLQAEVEFKIGIEREVNRNYITFGDGNRYVVKDTNRLLSLDSARDMTKVINILLEPNIVGMTGREIRSIIENGKAALEQERIKQNEMLAMAVEMFKCQKVEEALLDNGRVASGYTVKGKLREYLIDDSTLRVFEYPTGKYLCMVDKGQNEHANIPRLVSRMFALANDSKLANDISTLQKTNAN